MVAMETIQQIGRLQMELEWLKKSQLLGLLTRSTLYDQPTPVRELTPHHDLRRPLGTISLSGGRSTAHDHGSLL